MQPEEDTLIENLHRLYFKKLTLYAISILRDPSRAQDVVQDTFHEAILHIDDLMFHDKPGGWLMTTLKYKLKESERRNGRYLRHFLSLDSDVFDDIADPDATITEPSETDALLAMGQIKQTLTPEEYHLLKRLTLDKASHLEVSQELHISVYASQKRLERIRDKLYKVFPERRTKKK